MGLPCVVNGVAFRFVHPAGPGGGKPPLDLSFSGGSPVVKAATLPVVRTTDMCGGSSFLADSVTTVLSVDGESVVLAGATITFAPPSPHVGYVGTTSAANAAGTFLQAT